MSTLPLAKFEKLSSLYIDSVAQVPRVFSLKSTRNRMRSLKDLKYSKLCSIDIFCYAQNGEVMFSQVVCLSVPEFTIPWL